MDAVSPLASARRIVVKIGSALLIDEAGAVRSPWLAGLAEDIVELRRQKKDVVIVSSGAVALGRQALALSGKLRLEEKQAAAAAGQARLVHAYEEALRPHDIRVAQVLVTLDDAERRRRYLNARATLHTLMELRAVPVVNENDTIATEEIRYGDNDRLAAHTAQMAAADCLILLSDIDGLYTDDPNGPTPGTYIPTVREITPEIEAMAAPETASDKVGTGGMATKLMAAKIALGAGCAMAIARGTTDRPLSALLGGARCTWFLPSASPRAARKQWIAGRLRPQGTVRIDEGAQRALRAGKSLLPAGVTQVEGEFERGDAVAVAGPDGARLGIGLIAFDAADAKSVCGRRSDEVERIVGYRGRPAMIDRDDLALDEAAR